MNQAFFIKIIRTITSLALLAAIALTLFGVIANYSPVPFWDTWDGSIEFYLKLQNGDLGAWWALHNEHRILFSKALFFIDHEFFRGENHFLIAFNVALMVINALMVTLFAYRMHQAGNIKRPFLLIALWVFAWLFLWMQQQNINWEFQSQFFVVQTFMLCTFYFLSRSANTSKITLDFVLACLFGAGSIGTMANGLFIMPLVVVYLLLLRQNRWKIFIATSLAVFLSYLYLKDFSTPAKHGNLASSLLENPVLILEYVGLYLGSPFFYLFPSTYAKTIALIFGLSFLAAFLFLGLIILRSKKAPLPSAIYFCIAFIIISAIVTGGGRVIFGVEQALESRYTTPALIAWALLVILFSQYILVKQRSAYQYIVVLSFFIFSMGMLHAQMSALNTSTMTLFARKVGALALSLNIRDEARFQSIYFDTDQLMRLSSQAQKMHTSVFSREPYSGGIELIGKDTSLLTTNPCVGFIDGESPIAGEDRFMKIFGWIFNEKNQSAPAYVRLVDVNGKLAGYAITGSERQDVSAKYGHQARYSGFEGYVLSSLSGEKLQLVSGSLDCAISLSIPPVIFSSHAQPLAARASNVSVAQVTGQNNWVGTDYNKTTVDGLQVFGSYITGDADTGEITLLLHPGDKLYYRTGPNTTRQFIEVQGIEAGIYKVAPLSDWMLLDFSSLPIKSKIYMVKFVDRGSDWGEWSAIAIQKKPSKPKFN
jgi:hypothetical protein